MTTKKKIVFVVNPISGTQGKRAILKWIDERINRTLYDYTIVKTQYAGHAEKIAATAAKEKVDIVVAIGGDGTINEIGRALIHTDTALGIIPCGSGNGLARHLQIPLEPKAAIDIINESSVACIDYGKINNIPFFCTCGVGFDAFVSLKFADSGKRGLLTYLENTLHESLSYKPETYEIENEEGTVKYKAFLIACGDASQYGNNAYIAPQASLTDGLMDVTILEPFTVLDVPSLSFQLFNKTIDQNSRIKTFRTKKIKIGPWGQLPVRGQWQCAASGRRRAGPGRRWPYRAGPPFPAAPWRAFRLPLSSHPPAPWGSRCSSGSCAASAD